MQPAYPAARIAAKQVHPHFARHLLTGLYPDLLPRVETLEEMIDVAFWASLRREETYSPKISLAFAAPEHVTSPLVFARPIPLSPHALTRLGPAVERPGVHLGVWRQADGSLAVWGAARDLPRYCCVMEAVSPGLLVVKHSRGEDSGKFVNAAVLQGDEVKIIDQDAPTPQECPELLTSLLGLLEQDGPGYVNVLIQLSISMRAHGRGGLLLVTPAESSTWQESVMQPMTYSAEPSFGALTDLMSQDPVERMRRRWQEGFRRIVDTIAGLTAVDGATVITDRHELLAFGAKIIRKPGREMVTRVILTEPVEGTSATVVEPEQLGGTRHLSAAQFVHDQQDSIALVASQDGRFTVFAWSPCENLVHAHRIDILLL